MTQPTPPPAAKSTPAKKTTRARRTPRAAATGTSGTTTSETIAASRLPKVGALVAYDAADPVTGEQLVGLGVVIEAYTHGEGKNRIDRVQLSRLSSDLNLSADDVKAVSTT